MEEDIKTKQCKICGKTKSISEYWKNKGGKFGVGTVCKLCANWRDRPEKFKQKILEKELLFSQGLKKCPNCDTIKSVEEFRKDQYRKDGLRVYCIECENKLSKEHDQRPEIRQKRHERDKLPESKENRRQYRQNSDKFKATQEKFEKSEKRKQWRLKYSQTEMFKLKRTVRNNIYRMVKYGAIIEDAYFLDALGCTANGLKAHIESLWLEGMSWENYSHKGWHIDHIRPMAMFNLKDKDQFNECAHYTNLQPLWAKDNFTKNSIYDGKKRFVKDVIK